MPLGMTEKIHGNRRTIRRMSLHDETFAVLREMVVEGALPPGERIAEPALCEELGISRTPLREAIKVLASEGLVELKPSQGAVVTRITGADVEALFEMMEALEFQVGHLVATRATDEDMNEVRDLHDQMLMYHRAGRRAAYFDINQEIHLKLAHATKNQYLAADYEKYLGKIRRARYMANLSQARWNESVQEHEEIMAALYARDGENLGGILREHLRRTAVIVISAIKKGHAAEPASKSTSSRNRTVSE
ncbi:MAG: GntR family transcriptional regulator [Pseudomonadales bacterium]